MKNGWFIKWMNIIRLRTLVSTGCIVILLMIATFDRLQKDGKEIHHETNKIMNHAPTWPKRWWGYSKKDKKMETYTFFLRRDCGISIRATLFNTYRWHRCRISVITLFIIFYIRQVELLGWPSLRIRFRLCKEIASVYIYGNVSGEREYNPAILQIR